jgi:3-phosphoshikimate 1-carboxyvinyltransferase
VSRDEAAVMQEGNRVPIPFLDVAPIKRAEGVVELPGSKSISNRTLLLAALAAGDTQLSGLLDADDVDRMLAALAALGIGVTQVRGTRDFVVQGQGGAIPVKSARLHLGNAGTAFRPLAAVLAVAGGHYELSGVPRMHERPIGHLVDALRHLGADIRYLGKAGFPPLAVGPGAVDAQGTPDRVTVRGDVSSQFTSALLMALPLVTARGGQSISVDIAGDLISKPYVSITTHLMARFGVAVEQDDWRSFRVPRRARYASPRVLHVEGDASSASYFLAAGAIGGGPVRVVGVGRNSIQGDVAFADALERMGARIDRGDNWIEARSGSTLTGMEIDCTPIPDAAMTLAIVALFAHGPTTMTGIASWRVKETDRIAAMATELRKLGAEVDAGADRLTVSAPPRFVPATIATYDDHRMAMCFSLAALGGIRVRILDPECVAKTFPGYFAVFERVVIR